MGSYIFADEPIALITKSRGNAKYKNSSESKFRLNAQVNTTIFNGNRIKTKAKSFVQIVYLDDRSTVSAYSKSEVIINGKIDNRMISKQVDVTAGIVRVQIFNQLKSAFKLTTPHSTLTCQKCDFWIISDNKEGDRFYKISGNILITNPSMIETMELVYDSTILSLKDTGMEISQTPATEIKYLQLLMYNVDEMPVQSNEELAMKNKVGDKSSKATSHVVEIRLKNALNIQRKIILTYTK